MNYKKLADEILTNAAYNGMTSSEIADELNVPDKIVLRQTPVTSLTVMKLMGAVKGAEFLDTLTTIGAQNQAVKWALVNVSTAGVDVSDTEVRGMLTTLSAAGALSDADTNLLLSAAEYTVSRASELGFGTLSAQMIETALAGRA